MLADVSDVGKTDCLQSKLTYGDEAAAESPLVSSAKLGFFL